ncbi:DUF2530 domain-containing protein [Jatrophihabitans sp. DSM 45814]
MSDSSTEPADKPANNGAPRSPESAETPESAESPQFNRPVPAHVEMLSVDARKVILAGTILFFVAFVALLPFWNWLGDHGHRVWLWTCLAGWLLGIAAFPLIRKHSDEGRLG